MGWHMLQTCWGRADVCVVTATVVVLTALAVPVFAQGNTQDMCPGGNDPPTPVAVEVTAVPIVVTSTTDGLLRALCEPRRWTSTEVRAAGGGGAGPVRDDDAPPERGGAAGKQRYRVEKYAVATPADVDGDCVDDLTDPNPVNPAGSVALTDGAVVIPDQNTFNTLAVVQLYVKFIIVDMSRPIGRLSTS